MAQLFSLGHIEHEAFIQDFVVVVPEAVFHGFLRNRRRVALACGDSYGFHWQRRCCAFVSIAWFSLYVQPTDKQNTMRDLSDWFYEAVLRYEAFVA